MAWKYKTGEILEDCVKFLEEKKIPFEVRETASMLIVYHPDKDYKKYDFRYTTGRWSPLPNKKIHYRSKGIEDFIERFLLS